MGSGTENGPAVQVSSFYSGLVVLSKSRRFIQVLSFRAQRGISSPGTGRGRFLAALGMTRITYGKLTGESLLTESLLGESLLTESLLAARHGALEVVGRGLIAMQLGVFVAHLGSQLVCLRQDLRIGLRSALRHHHLHQRFVTARISRSAQLVDPGCVPVVLRKPLWIRPRGHR